MVRQTVEREIKLTVPPEFRLPALPGELLPPRAFTSIYYDTTDFRLAHAGVTLRRRTERRRARWQLKLERGAARLELECRGGPSGPPGDLRDLLFAHIHDLSLQPVATLRTRRTGVRVRGIDGPIADVTVDRVAVLQGRHIVRRFAEAEIEQTGHDEKPLHRLALVLREAGAGDHDQRPKLFRALDLDPRRLTPPGVHASAAEHLRAALQRQVDSLLAHDPGTRLGTDPEDLHQMRVATRRLRAYLRAARPLLEREWADALREELGWLGRALGPARDFDVMRQHVQKQATAAGEPDRRALARILSGLDRQGAGARATMLDVLRSDRYLKLVDRLRGAALAPWVNDSAVSLAQFAAKEFKKLRKAMGDFEPGMSDDALHRLRIRGKRARYAAELAEPAAGKPAGRFIKAAKAFQDCLGDHQDAVAAEGHLRRLISGTRGSATALTAGMLIERFHRQRRKARQTLAKAWKRLDKRGQKAWAALLEAASPCQERPSHENMLDGVEIQPATSGGEQTTL